ncbi:hypothetical protein B0A55_05553 [Friedmanniomyces simplex]|uniref:F-box domain-containing protein n=1 Tax=Friedmanniomyces simplex TaxID=329884 RepID=A0A4U0X839_9PEZI|nr:hypothetical protein B0A55_05553 [Friedmanniomyces simplex]
MTTTRLFAYDKLRLISSWKGGERLANTEAHFTFDSSNEQSTNPTIHARNGGGSSARHVQYELLEIVLSWLPCDRLLVVQRVSVTWHKTIERSQRLQQGLFQNAAGPTLKVILDRTQVTIIDYANTNEEQICDIGTLNKSGVTQGDLVEPTGSLLHADTIKIKLDTLAPVLGNYWRVVEAERVLASTLQAFIRMYEWEDPGESPIGWDPRGDGVDHWGGPLDGDDDPRRVSDEQDAGYYHRFAGGSKRYRHHQGGIVCGQMCGGFLDERVGRVKYQCMAMFVVGGVCLGSVAVITAENKPSELALVFLGSWFIGWKEMLCPANATITVHDQQEIGGAGSVAGSIRGMISSISLSVYTSVLTNRLSATNPARLPSALVQAGLPSSSASGFLQAITAGSAAAFKVVPGVSAGMIAAGIAGLFGGERGGIQHGMLGSVAATLHGRDGAEVVEREKCVEV